MIKTTTHSGRIAQPSIPIPTLEAIAQHVIDVKDWSFERQQQYLNSVLQQFSKRDKGLPDEISAISNPDFREYLLGNRWFADRCNIPFGRMDDYLDVIIVGIAKYCVEKYFQRQTDN